MADEYIRRDDVKDALKEKVFHNLTDELYGAMQAIDELPAADVAPVVHGKWMPQKGGGLCCSECDEYALDEPDGNFIHVAVPSKFCPNCGAKMDGEE